MTEKVIRVRVDSGNSTQEINALNSSMRSLGSAADTAGAKSGKFSQIMGQAGFQIQDFIVQVQGGTSAITAFTQQAPQFAGAFGPGGAVIGALLAAGGVLTGVFLSSLNSAKNAISELEKSAEILGKTLSDTTGVTKFTEELEKLASRSESLAKLQISQGIIESEKQIKISTSSLLTATRQFVAKSGSQLQFFRRDFEKSAEQIGLSFNELAEDLSKLELLKFKKGNAADVANQVIQLSERLGITREEAFKLSIAISDAFKEKDAASIKRLENALVDISNAYGGANKAVTSFAVSQLQNFDTITDAQNKLNLLRQAYADLSETVSKTNGPTKEQQERLDKLKEATELYNKVLADNKKSEDEALAARLKVAEAAASQIDQLKQQTALMQAESAIRTQLANGEITQEQANQAIALENLAAYYTNRRQAIIDNTLFTEEQKRALILELNLQEQEAAILQEQRLTDIKDKGAKDRERISALEAKQTKDMLINTAVTAFNLMQNSNQKMTKEQKKQAKRSVYIQTAAAIARAYGENNFYVASAMAVFLAAMQLRQINAIETATGSGGTAAAPTLSAGAGGGGNQTKFINITGIDQNSLISGAQLAEILKTDDDVVVSFANGLDDAKRRGVISG